MGIVAVGCLLAIGIVFAVAAFSKLRDFSGFADGLRRLGVVPANLLRPVAVLVVVGEIVTVVLLAIPATIGLGFATAAVMLTVFTVGIVRGLGRQSTAPCRCFGASERPLSRVHVVRNLVLLLVVAVGLASTSQLGAVVPAGAVVGGAAGIVVAVTMMALDDIVDLFQMRA